MELPATGPGDVVLQYEGFTLKYNTRRLIPDWVAYELTAEELEGNLDRSGSFGMDMGYKGRQAMREDYSNSGWDKGHMAPAADMKWSRKAMEQSFYLTNICPQNHDLNSKAWNTLEKYVRDWARRYGRVWVVCGPYVSEGQVRTIGSRKVTVPDGFFKAVLRHDKSGYHSLAFLFENNSGKQPVKKAIVSVNEVEALTGFDLFTGLDDAIEEEIEAQTSWSAWN
ncbi:MAG: DNA/RNA non-specific endonuclease [Bacteroidales bacterium]|nr:DNA/RNA non-specific endonuclease [Bacteroidales bacterium]